MSVDLSRFYHRKSGGDTSLDSGALMLDRGLLLLWVKFSKGEKDKQVVDYLECASDVEG